MSEAPLPCPTAFVVNDLARAGARSLLEVVSVTTGWPISAGISSRGFARHVRLVYASEMHRSDLQGLTGFPDRETLCWRVNALNEQFDVVFVDPWHTVEDSLSIIRVALGTVRPGGILIVHDCHPHDESLRVNEPTALDVPWCGETWKVWHRLTAELDDSLAWRTVDHDNGIGTLVKPTGRFGQGRLRRALDRVNRLPSGSWETVEWSPNPPHIHLSSQLSLCDMMTV